jgi:NADPH2:quinone reductase
VASLQLGKALGARVIGTSGSAAKLERLKALGLDVALATRAPDFAPQVMELTGQKGVNLVVNTVGGSVFAENVRCMAFEARLATVGYVDGVLKGDLDIEALHAKRLTLFGVSNKLRTPEQRPPQCQASSAEVLPHLSQRPIVPLVDQVVDFADLPAGQGGHGGRRPHPARSCCACPTPEGGPMNQSDQHHACCFQLC